MSRAREIAACQVQNFRLATFLNRAPHARLDRTKAGDGLQASEAAAIAGRPVLHDQRVAEFSGARRLPVQ
jgi:hypothetical protein